MLAIKPELLNILPATTERSGKVEKVIPIAAFREEHGPEADFRASESRPGYYTVLAADGSKSKPFKPISPDSTLLKSYAAHILLEWQNEVVMGHPIDLKPWKTHIPLLCWL